MRKDTFKIAKDPQGKRNLYQAKGETDKNHNENDTENSNQGYICEIPGMTLPDQIALVSCFRPQNHNYHLFSNYLTQNH